MSKLTPSAATKRNLEADGWTVAKTEHWNPFAKIRQDMFGFVDFLAVKSGSPPLFIQATSKSNMSSRVKKILANPTHKILNEFGDVEVWGWEGKDVIRKLVG